MKAAVITFLLNAFWMAGFCRDSEINLAGYPFDIKVLQNLSDKKDSIMPVFKEGKFQYVDVKTGTRIFEKTFDIAYPFDGRNAAIIKSDGKYGIIDRHGKLLAAPEYRSFQLWDAPFRENFVSFDNASDYGFDLQKGIFVNPGNGCEKPFMERPCCVIYKQGDKYGISKIKDNNYSSQRILIAPVFDTVYLINAAMAIGSKEDKIICIDSSGKPFFLGIYKEVIMSRPLNEFSYPQVIGLNTGRDWEYYRVGLKPELLLTSEFKCSGIGEVRIRNAFGIYQEKGKFHILYQDGQAMKEAYDWIS
ncbi:hypothetical protein F0919_15435 [Taibaiella lutea]|uniref:WG repeat-containing protein n=1 Tax=Taibaiella lutea TaxID=2608001 RepID=A0A5M6CE99_9BACT|nr:WG repeat-containing protein [Taibaiella lutea]KAA5532192.1 hypothetical protein F0919_15435 [Taibaiella lutea]